jgi:hypothetical protein
LISKSTRSQQDQYHRYLQQHLIQVARAAREERQLQMALNFLYQAEATAAAAPLSQTFEIARTILIEKAKLLWQQGESRLAMRQIEQILLQTPPISSNARENMERSQLLFLLVSQVK